MTPNGTESAVRRVRVPSGEMLVRDTGHNNIATPLLLIHGFGGSSRVWDAMVARLSKSQRVLCVDLLGHGESDQPDVSYAVPDQALAVIAVLDQLRIARAHLVAHSAGGDIAVAMIERSRARFASATFLGTAPDLQFVHKSLAAKLMLIPGLGTAMWAIATDEMIRDGLAKAFAPGSGAPPDLYVRALRQLSHRTYRRCLTQIERFKARRNLCLRMQGHNIPTLVVFGTQDQWVDPAAAKMWEVEVGSQVEILEAVGHTHMAEAPETTADIVSRFVSRCADGAIQVTSPESYQCFPSSYGPPRSSARW